MPLGSRAHHQFERAQQCITPLESLHAALGEIRNRGANYAATSCYCGKIM